MLGSNCPSAPKGGSSRGRKFNLIWYDGLPLVDLVTSEFGFGKFVDSPRMEDEMLWGRGASGRRDMVAGTRRLSSSENMEEQREIGVMAGSIICSGESKSRREIRVADDS